MVGFFSIIDPQSALDLIEIAETRITDEEVQALHPLIADGVTRSDGQCRSRRQTRYCCGRETLLALPLSNNISK
jgi:hypothetical protein